MTFRHRRSDVTHACIEPGLPAVISARGRIVAERFGVSSLLPTTHARRARTAPADIALPDPGQVMFIQGASGSGKSSLLRGLVSRGRRRNLRVVRPTDVALPAKPVIDLFGDEPLERTLRRLSRVGLAEVWTWLRTPAQLSAGQRWRLRLALTMARMDVADGPTLLVCDEFAAVLDRVTACVVAGVVRRVVNDNRGHLAALIATSQDDIARALSADICVSCDFGRYTVTRTARDD